MVNRYHGRGGGRQGRGPRRHASLVSRTEDTPHLPPGEPHDSPESPPSSLLPKCPFHRWKIQGSERSRNSPGALQHLGDELEYESRSS